ncbi:acetyltransferase [Colletotrichum truncatum]|uniref:Acetyltransferase n=1 Tax=Colletotrichum truncatum TaxID=5467 RepID=A0ACC3YTY6_COLTU
MEKIQIRDAGVSEDDAAFIVEAFDSTLPHLTAIGSSGMWGLTPFSQKDGFTEETIKDVRDSCTHRLTGEGEALRIFIAEVEVSRSDDETPHAGLRFRTDDNGTRYLSVGAAFVRENWVPGHLEAQFHVDGIRAELEGREDFVFLDVLVTDYRAGELRKGAGEVLMKKAGEFGVERGKKVLYLDAWSGNERKLVRFYEQRGFNVVAEFEINRANGTTWPGALLKRELLD